MNSAQMDSYVTEGFRREILRLAPRPSVTHRPLPKSVVLSSGRTIRHERHVNGFIDAIPTTGEYYMTPDEHKEYVRIRGLK